MSGVSTDQSQTNRAVLSSVCSQTRSPTLSNSPTLYGDTISSGLQSALVDSNLPFMANAAERLREMRERDAPTLLGLQRRSASPPSLVAARHQPTSDSPEHELRLPVSSLLSDTAHPPPPPSATQPTDYGDNPRTPESRDGGASRDAVAENGNNGAEVGAVVLALMVILGRYWYIVCLAALLIYLRLMLG